VLETSAVPQTSPSASAKYLAFALGGEEYAIEILRVQEILGLLPITRVPRMPSSVRGVVNLRGKVIPIMDLRAALGLPVDAAASESCIIVVQVRGVQVGVLVDSVSEVTAIAVDQIEPPPSFGDGVRTHCLCGIAKSGTRVRLLLDIEQALSADIVRGVAGPSFA
jgi:purine-binding chemotaxis protein CheW